MGGGGGIGMRNVSMSNKSMSLCPQHLITCCILGMVYNGNNPRLSIRKKEVFRARLRLSFLFYEIKELN